MERRGSLFKECTFHLALGEGQAAQQLHPKLTACIEACEGSVSASVRPGVTHLVALHMQQPEVLLFTQQQQQQAAPAPGGPSSSSPPEEAAGSCQKRIVSAKWVYHCWKAGQLLAVERALGHQPFPAASMPGLAQRAPEICISGYSDLERHLMLLRVEGLGTRAVTSIKRSSTSHLLVKDPSQPSAKVQEVVARGYREVRIVTQAWLDECIRQWAWVPEGRYLVATDSIITGRTTAAAATTEKGPAAMGAPPPPRSSHGSAAHPPSSGAPPSGSAAWVRSAAVAAATAAAATHQAGTASSRPSEPGAPGGQQGGGGGYGPAASSVAAAAPPRPWSVGTLPTARGPTGLGPGPSGRPHSSPPWQPGAARTADASRPSASGLAPRFVPGSERITSPRPSSHHSTHRRHGGSPPPEAASLHSNPRSPSAAAAAGSVQQGSGGAAARGAGAAPASVAGPPPGFSPVPADQGATKAAPIKRPRAAAAAADAQPAGGAATTPTPAASSAPAPPAMAVLSGLTEGLALLSKQPAMLTPAPGSSPAPRKTPPGSGKAKVVAATATAATATPASTTPPPPPQGQLPGDAVECSGAGQTAGEAGVGGGCGKLDAGVTAATTGMDTAGSSEAASVGVAAVGAGVGVAALPMSPPRASARKARHPQKLQHTVPAGEGVAAAAAAPADTGNAACDPALLQSAPRPPLLAAEPAGAAPGSSEASTPPPPAEAAGASAGAEAAAAAGPAAAPCADTGTTTAIKQEGDSKQAGDTKQRQAAKPLRSPNAARFTPLHRAPRDANGSFSPISPSEEQRVFRMAAVGAAAAAAGDGSTPAGADGGAARPAAEAPSAMQQALASRIVTSPAGVRVRLGIRRPGQAGDAATWDDAGAAASSRGKQQQQQHTATRSETGDEDDGGAARANGSATHAEADAAPDAEAGVAAPTDTKPRLNVVPFPGLRRRKANGATGSGAASASAASVMAASIQARLLGKAGKDQGPAAGAASQAGSGNQELGSIAEAVQLMARKVAVDRQRAAARIARQSAAHLGGSSSLKALLNGAAGANGGGAQQAGSDGGEEGEEEAEEEKEANGAALPRDTSWGNKELDALLGLPPSRKKAKRTAAAIGGGPPPAAGASTAAKARQPGSVGAAATKSHKKQAPLGKPPGAAAARADDHATALAESALPAGSGKRKLPGSAAASAGANKVAKLASGNAHSSAGAAPGTAAGTNYTASHTGRSHGGANGAAAAEAPAGPPAGHVLVTLSGMKSEDRAKYAAICKQLRLAMTAEENKHVWQAGTTHVIALSLSRSDKTMCGMAAGNWLLSTGFLNASLAAGRLVPPEAHELRSSAAPGVISEGAPGHWRARAAARGAAAFAGVKAVLYGALEAPSADTLLRIIRAGGGQVVACEPPYDAAALQRAGVSLAVLAADKTSSDRWVEVLLSASLLCVSAQYVVDWVAHPWQPLKQHWLFGCTPGAALRQLEEARGRVTGGEGQLRGKGR